MRPIHALLSISAAAIAILSLPGCSSTNPSGTLTGTVSDPSGDARVDARLAVSPDLVGATVNISGTNLVLTISFAPGTLSQSDSKWDAYFDTDENIATGFPGVDGSGSDSALLGVDYFVEGVSPRGSTQAIVYRYDNPAGALTMMGNVTVTFPSATQIQVTVPLSLLGGDDGRMKFKVNVAQWLSATGATGAIDYMPDVGLAAGVVR